jgi:Icc-related predicted phosphoesterase
MRIGFISDIHDNPRTMDWLAGTVKVYDVVAIGGDVGELRLLNRVVEFAVGRQVFIVLGNQEHVVKELLAVRNVLHGTSIRVGRYTMGGIGGSLPFDGGLLELDETQFASLAKNLGPVDLLIAHQPPINTRCDMVFDGLSDTGVIHAGSAAIREYIEETQPLLALVGHIHESPGVDSIGRTAVVNPGPFMMGNYAEVELEGQSAPRVELKNIGR